MAISVKGIAWLGTRTPQFDAMRRFYTEQMGLAPAHEEAGFVVFDLPNGDRVELFSETSPYNTEFGSAPVAGFEVEDIEASRAELEGAGTEFLGPMESGGDSSWTHFRAPDGNIYELTSRRRP